MLAYAGPGLGAGIVAMVLGIIGSFFLAILGVVWYPVKRVLKRLRRVKPGQEPQDVPPEALAD